jgi:hypothetical protein
LNKLLFVASVLLILVSACVPVSTTTTSVPPDAFIDSETPISITQGEKLTLSGHGISKTENVVAYQWRSDIDGIISNQPSFSTSSLSATRHTIYFKVQGQSGTWSKEKYFFINILPASASKPTINSFMCSPNNIVEGAVATLSWNVTNATSVSIDPDIGNVSLIGSRSLSPRVSTTYVITAVNAAGQVSNEARLMIVSAQTRSLELYTVIPENGSIRYDGITSPIPLAGVKDGPYQWQCFLSFDISMIPQNAIIKSVSLDLSNHEVIGSPFNNLGNMGVFALLPTRVGTKLYVSPYPGGALFSTRTEPTQPILSGMLLSSLQDSVSLRATRYQLRIQFEKYYYSLTGDNYLSFSNERTRLLITYE